MGKLVEDSKHIEPQRVSRVLATGKIINIIPIKLVTTGSYQKKSHYKKPLFQKRHHEAIAEIIAKMDSTTQDIGDLAVELSRMFGRDNPNYDLGRFYTTCTTPLPPEEPAPQEESTVKLNNLEPINWGELRAVRRQDV